MAIFLIIGWGAFAYWLTDAIVDSRQLKEGEEPSGGFQIGMWLFLTLVGWFAIVGLFINS